MSDTKILDGKAVSEATLLAITERVKGLSGQPGLAVILVGDDPASRVYVNSKKKACERVGFASFEYALGADTTEAALTELIQSLNNRDDVHGILLQLPLPKGLDGDKMLHLIDPAKDVDGFHPSNVGKLLLGLPTFRSCTPYGVMEILDFYNIDLTGKHVVILGRSNIVGKPLAAMMIAANATVTVCHSRTQNLPEISRQADVLVAAIGRPEFVTADMVKPGAVVVDVGINRVDDADAPRGYRLLGDVAYGPICELASAITPVPGGVGPMTIAMLLKNTLQSFEGGRA